VQRNLADQRLIPGVNLSLKLSGVGATGPYSCGKSLQRNRRKANVSWQTVPHKKTSDCKVVVPSSVLVLGTMRHRLSADQRCRLPATVMTGTQSLTRYGGTNQWRHL